MPYPPLLYSKVLDSLTDGDAAYSLEGKQRYLLQAVLASVLDKPSMYFEDFADYSVDDIVSICEDTLNAIMVPVSISKIPHIRLSPENHFDIVGNAVVWSPLSTHMYGGTFVQSPGANNDRISYYVPIQAGNYRIRCLYAKTSAGAKIDFMVASSVRGTLDTYNATTLQNQIYTSSNFAVSGDAFYEIWSVVNGRNASNTTGYLFNHVYWELQRIS